MKKWKKITAALMTALLVTPMMLQYIPTVSQIIQAEATAKKPAISMKQFTTGIGTASKEIDIKNKLKNAKYTFYSSNKKVVTVDKIGKINGISEGSAIITAKQNYKNKITTIGTCKVMIELSSVDSTTKKIECGINGELLLDQWIKINHSIGRAKYSYESENTKIALIQTSSLCGISMGDTLIHVYETYEGTKREVGTVSVTIKDIPMTNLQADPYYIIDGNFQRILYFDDISENKSLDMKTTLIKTPSNATDYISYVSQNPSVAAVDKNGIITAVGKGETTVTAISGSSKVVMHIISISCLEEDNY